MAILRPQDNINYVLYASTDYPYNQRLQRINDNIPKLTKYNYKKYKKITGTLILGLEDMKMLTW